MDGGEVDAQIFEFLKLINFNQGHFRSLVRKYKKNAPHKQKRLVNY